MNISWLLLPNISSTHVHIATFFWLNGHFVAGRLTPSNHSHIMNVLPIHCSGQCDISNVCKHLILIVVPKQIERQNVNKMYKKLGHHCQQMDVPILRRVLCERGGDC